MNIKSESEGMRSRKRRQTRDRIATAAMTLFVERGYDEVTVDDIAGAADVSKRSFFDYFPAKEDVVLAWQDDFSVKLAAAVAERPLDEPLTRVIEEALTSAVTEALLQPQIRALNRLIEATPALHARDLLKFAVMERTLAKALQSRVPDESGKGRVALLAMVVVGWIRLTAQARPTNDFSAEEVPEQMRMVFASLWSELEQITRGGSR